MKYWMPIQDGYFLKDNPMKLFLDGKYSKLPLLLGHTENEFKASLNVQTKEELNIKAKELFGDNADEFLKLIGWPDDTIDNIKKSAEVHAIEYAIRIYG